MIYYIPTNTDRNPFHIVEESYFDTKAPVNGRPISALHLAYDVLTVDIPASPKLTWQNNNLTFWSICIAKQADHQLIVKNYS